MKALIQFFIISMICVNFSFGQNRIEFKVVTIVESIVPGGVGRSRIIETGSELNVDDFSADRTDGKKSKLDADRKDLKVDEFNEAKLLNFYSITGINFQNIASNDALITSKINKLIDEGWDLAFVTSGVESDAGVSKGLGGGQNDGKGIFITRLFFKRVIDGSD
ncbi:hypothetical protein [Ekhidna sp.]